MLLVSGPLVRHSQLFWCSGLSLILGQLCGGTWEGIGDRRVLVAQPSRLHRRLMARMLSHCRNVGPLPPESRLFAIPNVSTDSEIFTDASPASPNCNMMFRFTGWAVPATCAPHNSPAPHDSLVPLNSPTPFDLPCPLSCEYINFQRGFETKTGMHLDRRFSRHHALRTPYLFVPHIGHTHVICHSG
jgi:hypothetical protein